MHQRAVQKRKKNGVALQTQEHKTGFKCNNKICKIKINYEVKSETLNQYYQRIGSTAATSLITNSIKLFRPSSLTSQKEKTNQNKFHYSNTAKTNIRYGTMHGTSTHTRKNCGPN